MMLTHDWWIWVNIFRYTDWWILGTQTLSSFQYPTQIKKQKELDFWETNTYSITDPSFYNFQIKDMKTF